MKGVGGKPLSIRTRRMVFDSNGDLEHSEGRIHATLCLPIIPDVASDTMYFFMARYKYIGACFKIHDQCI